MTIGISSYFLAFLAGSLSTISPCVLPILPLLIASATNSHRYGVWALSAGLALSFSTIGLFVATVGISIGFDGTVFRTLGAILFLVFGAVLLLPAIDGRLSFISSGLSQFGTELLQKIGPEGLRGQFLVGLVMGLIWSPCVGPTLGAASTLAAQGQSLPLAGTLMFVFGLGAAMPLLILGNLSRVLMAKLRHRLLITGVVAKKIMGCVLLILGGLVLLGLDKSMERWLVELSPM
ncbi:MAG: cytochrome c biogenesis CcdA family protein, partial [Hyphomicrobiaceae bacterium]|nr:cytochrome c biogenesis CcdA family protein [Hyphomicrobiaceae bacterium]